MNNGMHAPPWHVMLLIVSVSIAQELSPIVLIDDFSDGDLRCALPEKSAWYFYGYGNNGSQVTPKIEEDAETGKFLNCTFTVRQPGTDSLWHEQRQRPRPVSHDFTIPGIPGPIF
jgi:hypothetical protein